MAQKICEYLKFHDLNVDWCIQKFQIENIIQPKLDKVETWS